MPDTGQPEEDAPTLQGVRVSAAQLGHVFDYAKATSEGMISMHAKIDQMAEAVKAGTESQIRAADIAEERLKWDKEDRDAKRDLEKAEVARQAALDTARFKVISNAGAWFQENWKIIAVAALFLVNPSSFKAARDMGLLTLVGFPPVVEQAAPAPVVVPVPVPVAPASVPVPPVEEPAGAGAESSAPR